MMIMHGDGLNITLCKRFRATASLDVSISKLIVFEEKYQWENAAI